MTNTDKISSSLKVLRTELQASLEMTQELARSKYESQKANEQVSKIIAAWNVFHDEWITLKPEIQIDIETKEPPKKKAFSKLSRIIRKAKDD